MIFGIFYARFLPEQGVRVIHQSPPGCMSPEPGQGTTASTGIDFEAVSGCIVPRQGFCNRYIAVRDPSDRFVVMGCPVVISNQEYFRNEFIFNFGIVVEKKYDITPYESVVRRLASTFRGMEIQSRYLSNQGRGQDGQRPLGALLEVIREDLNNYNECMIPVDDSNTINVKLFPARPHPPAVKSWQVPLATIDHSQVVDEEWDISVCKVIPHIDGIRDVNQVARHAEVSVKLCKLALQHLLYRNTIILMDKFSFNNTYVVTDVINDFVANHDGMQEECNKYALLAGQKLASWWLCRMYSIMHHGWNIKAWLKLFIDEGLDITKWVDVRRFIQFGVLRGILIRVHKTSVSKKYLAARAHGETDWAADKDPILKYADGCHTHDQVGVELGLSNEGIGRALAKLHPDVELLYR